MPNDCKRINESVLDIGLIVHGYGCHYAQNVKLSIQDEVHATVVWRCDR